MEYRQLGNTDLQVSLITLGSMTFGEQNTEEEAFAQMDYAFEQGVNCIDVAEMYPVPPKAETFGHSEIIVGNWLKARNLREQLVLATKITGRGDRNRGMEHIRDGARLNKVQIKQALEGSLKRLQTDRIDLYQLHWPERQTNFFGKLGYQHVEENDNIELYETLSALDELVREGKILNVGLSNETPWGLMECARLAREFNLPRIMSVQNPYNLLNRSYEVGLAEISIREQTGLLAYSPLAFGILTGKYLNNAKPANARLTLYKRFARYDAPNVEESTTAYVNIAQEAGLSAAQMALAFVNRQPFVTANIIGATSVEQLKENIASINVKLTDDTLAAIESVHQQYPNPGP